MTLIMKKWQWGSLLSRNFNDEDQTGFLEITPDAGKPFRRESFTDIDNLIRGSIIVDLDTYIEFKSWYRNTIKQGTISFTFFDCRTNTERIARILGKPLYRQISNKWNISIKLSLEQTIIYKDYFLLTEGGEYLLTEGGDKIITTKKLIV